MIENSTRFSNLRVAGWRQFADVELVIHPRLTVLTGANGAGKSSLLRIFSRHFGYDRAFLGTPSQDKLGNISYATGLFSDRLSNLFRSLFPLKKRIESEVGTLGYSNGSSTSLHVPEKSSVTFSINLNNQQQVSGIHIDSHQPVPFFQQVTNIPAGLISPEIAFSSYNGDVLQKYAGGHTGYTPIYRMKEAIISMALFGEGNSSVQPNNEIYRAYRDFVSVLKKILPDSLGFIDISVRSPEVVLITRSGEFILDAASGGLMTLIDLTWRLHLLSLTQAFFTVTMDEPENHLHPTMQRTLMPRLLSAFPQAQFIIATHSPFMVSSVKDSYVYALRYVNLSGEEADDSPIFATENVRVVSTELDTVNKAASANEILREVLGVSATIPAWVEEGVAVVVDRYKRRALSVEMLGELRNELESLGYDELYPEALARLTEN